jgi:glutathione S-transferase
VRRLYHFALSPYSRRARLVLATKGIPVELVDPRSEPTAMTTMKTLYPMRTAPVLVEEDGSALGDSGAIAQYVERTHPTPPLWPTDARDLARVTQVMALTDGALGTLIDLGTRYYALRAHEAWPTVKSELQGRAQTALDALAKIVGGLSQSTLSTSGWSIGDIWLYTAVAWLEGLPARAPTFVNAAQLISLEWRLPAELPRWADAHRSRSDVLSL